MAEILMYGPVGFNPFEPEDAITAKSVIQQLEQAGGEDVTVRMSSPGGDVYEGVAIMAALRSHPGKVTVIVESLAASAASFIAVGGADEVLMMPEAEMMIHRAMTYLEGNADEVARKLTDLERQDQKLATIYAGKAGGDVEQWLEAMSAETWYTAEEAVSAGLADSVVEVSKQVSVKEPAVSASVRGRFRFANRAAAPPPPRISRSVSGEDNDKPSDGQKGDKMDVLNQLAQELGRKPDEVRNVLSGFFNEAAEVNTPVTVEYPDEVTVIPTGKVEVAPVTPLSEGVTPEVAIGDGFTAELAGGGVVMVRANDDVKVNDTTDLVLTFEDTAITVKVTVVAADDEEEDGGIEEPVAEPAELAPVPETEASETAEFGEIPDGYTLVPKAHLEDLTARARMGDEAFNAKTEADLEAEVDQWIAEGRFAVARRATVLASMRGNAAMTRKTWGALPVNSIPRGEVGYGIDPHNPEGSAVPSFEDLEKKSKARLSGNKK